MCWEQTKETKLESQNSKLYSIYFIFCQGFSCLSPPVVYHFLVLCACASSATTAPHCPLVEALWIGTLRQPGLITT